MQRPLPGWARLVATVVAVVVCACLLSAAVLTPAPPAVLPFIIAICVGGPLFAGWDLSALRREPDDAVEELRRYLDRLPETQHPLGL